MKQEGRGERGRSCLVVIVAVVALYLLLDRHEHLPAWGVQLGKACDSYSWRVGVALECGRVEGNVVSVNGMWLRGGKNQRMEGVRVR
ncbi:hypothetical protein E2C01_006493 [Portunus trituberculatus]|uniref:Uncharacterized protein n=1 Tax=Portunus trituberculatus TaxID=210409 RepID=A0A5B7CWF8_PORTR|nr:hypothetical protein [Portunus trituberculatus]